MRAVLRGIAVCVAILAMGGACSAGGPAGKQACHCAQQNGCHCPLPPPPHAGNKPAGPPPAHRAARIEHRERYIVRHARRLERREARIGRREVERREVRGRHGSHMERREARLNRWEAWVERHEGRTAHREGRMERREARNWRNHERFRFYHGVAALPYDYRSTSRHYALHERFAGPGRREHFAMRGYAGPRGYADSYSEGGYGAEVSGGPSGERDYGYEHHYAEEGPGPEYGEEAPGPEYGEEGPGYAPEEQGYGGGYVSGASMSINSAAALDSWHGYGVECPPYE
jgi:hypothetical protein